MHIESLKHYEEMIVEYEKGESETHRQFMLNSGWTITKIDTESPFKGDKTTYTYRKEIK
ncbi:hypothetical protein WKH56_20035 [Priestia sp. SB1]|uniref:hypothetical protein n=1 Tax=Priestia sp. SB1 TaxID=3132359 RepID=UPI00317A7206